MLEGKRFAVLVEDQYEDQELWYPVRRLTEAGAAVAIVGPEAGKTYQSKHGYPATSDKAAEDVAVDDLDGIVIPGGYAPDRMRRHKAMVNLVGNAFQAGKTVAAICHAGWLLCSAGVLKGKQATSVSAIKDDMINAGAIWVDREVVEDGNLITSRTPDDLPAFLRTIIAASSRGDDAKCPAAGMR
jgi:protease I